MSVITARLQVADDEEGAIHKIMAALYASEDTKSYKVLEISVGSDKTQPAHGPTYRGADSSDIATSTAAIARNAAQE